MKKKCIKRVLVPLLTLSMCGLMMVGCSIKPSLGSLLGESKGVVESSDDNSDESENGSDIRVDAPSEPSRDEIHSTTQGSDTDVAEENESTLYEAEISEDETSDVTQSEVISDSVDTDDGQVAQSVDYEVPNEATSGWICIYDNPLQLPCSISDLLGIGFEFKEGESDLVLNPGYSTTSTLVCGEDRIIVSIVNMSSDILKYNECIVDAVSVYKSNIRDVVLPCGITFDTSMSEALSLLGEPTTSHDSDYPSYIWRESDEAYCSKFGMSGKKDDDSISSFDVTGSLN